MSEEETDETESSCDSDSKSDNVFSQPWNDSDVVLVVENEEFHVHRSILSLQSPVFKAMLNGNFKDAQQDKIELKDDKYEAMIEFLKLLYPKNMFDHNEGKVKIDDDNILGILQLADKYGAINVIKQCMRKADTLKSENIMRLLPYAARHDLPVKKILKVIGNDISTKVLENYAPELASDALYIQTLVTKCHTLEKFADQAYTMILFLLEEQGTMSMKCRLHGFLTANSFKRARKCKYCMKIYQKYLDEVFQDSSLSSSDVVGLLGVLDNIKSGLKST